MKKEYMKPRTLVVPIIPEGSPLCASTGNLIPLVEDDDTLGGMDWTYNP